MAVIYKAQQSSLPNKEGTKLYFPRVILTGNVDTNTIAREIAELSSLSTGDVKNVMDNLVSVMIRHLQASESVTIDGFGTFRYTLKSAGNGVETSEEVTAQQKNLKVRFLPSGVKESGVVTRNMTSGVQFARFDAATSASDETDSESGSNEEVNPLG